MAIRQYIGARYVPRFMGVYDNTQQYEALDVVDNGSGTSYIARKIVPPGTPLTDTEYWFMYGASSGAIINLQNQIDTINNTDLPALDTRLDDVEDRLGPKQKLIITDSYGFEVDANGKNFAQIVSDYLGETVDMMATGGGSFGANAPYLLKGLEDYTGDRDAVGHIIIVAGANDCSTNNANYNAIISGIHTFNAYARTNYPNAKISIIPCGLAYVNASGRTADARELVAHAYSDGAVYCNWGIALNAFYLLRDTRLLKTDGIHPSADGVTAIAEAILQYLNTGEVNFYHTISHTSTTSPGSNVDTVLVGFDEISESGKYYWRATRNPVIQVALTSAITPSNGGTGWINLGNIGDRLTDQASSTSQPHMYTCPCIVRDTSNVYYYACARFSIQNGVMWLDVYTDAPNVIFINVLFDNQILPQM